MAPGVPEVLGEQLSSDGTRKFLLGLQDGERIEAVYIPEGKRRTVCISSQVGCAVGCAFCLTARLGFKRNLAAGEIIGQLYALEARTDLREASYNVVFMGMGEPLLNRAEVEKALGPMEDPDGMNISWRRITVSTVGIADALLDFAKSPVCPRLALSLHSADEGLRSRLVPINHAYPLARLRKVLEELSRREMERVSIEYVLLGGVNDSDDDARRLARFGKGLKVKVNLIPFNKAEGLAFMPSSEERAAAFKERLVNAGIAVHVRKSRGLDIQAACGQLAREGWPRNDAEAQSRTNISPRRHRGHEGRQI
jgi:23S rRNA (adenine2503-C2)-methyltransferase